MSIRSKYKVLSGTEAQQRDPLLNLNLQQGDISRAGYQQQQQRIEAQKQLLPAPSFAGRWTGRGQQVISADGTITAQRTTNGAIGVGDRVALRGDTVDAMPYRREDDAEPDPVKRKAPTGKVKLLLHNRATGELFIGGYKRVPVRCGSIPAGLNVQGRLHNRGRDSYFAWIETAAGSPEIYTTYTFTSSESTSFTFPLLHTLAHIGYGFSVLMYPNTATDLNPNDQNEFSDQEIKSFYSGVISDSGYREISKIFIPDDVPPYLNRKYSFTVTYNNLPATPFFSSSGSVFHEEYPETLEQQTTYTGNVYMPIMMSEDGTNAIATDYYPYTSSNNRLVWIEGDTVLQIPTQFFGSSPFLSGNTSPSIAGFDRYLDIFNEELTAFNIPDSLYESLESKVAVKKYDKTLTQKSQEETILYPVQGLDQTLFLLDASYHA